MMDNMSNSQAEAGGVHLREVKVTNIYSVYYDDPTI